MTEQNVSYGSTAVAEPPSPLLPPSYDEAGDNGNRNKLLAVAAAVGVLVLLVVAFFLMKGGGSSDESLAPIVHHTAPAGTSGAGTGTTPADKPVALPKSYKHAVGRDPFKALYVAPAPVSQDTSTDTAKTPVVTVPGTGSTGTGSTGTGGTVTNPPAASYAPVWVSLDSVRGTRSATFTVGYSNGKSTKQATFSNIAAPTRSLRTTFGSVFALLSIQDGTATVQFGDGTPFDLAPGFGNRHFVS